MYLQQFHLSQKQNNRSSFVIASSIVHCFTVSVINLFDIGESQFEINQRAALHQQLSNRSVLAIATVYRRRKNRNQLNALYTFTAAGGLVNFHFLVISNKSEPKNPNKFMTEREKETKTIGWKIQDGTQWNVCREREGAKDEKMCVRCRYIRISNTLRKHLMPGECHSTCKFC